MATIKVYRCDVCGKEYADAKKLCKVYIEWGAPKKRGGYYSTPKRDGLQMDVCSGTCGRRISEAFTPFLGDVRATALAEYLVPAPPKAAKVPTPKTAV